MDYIQLGRTGLQVSRLCLGTMNFGPLTLPPDAYAIMDRAHELGINFFDTANRYGGPTTPPGQVAHHDEAHSGWTEEIIGDWFASGGGRRERTVLATKLFGAGLLIIAAFLFGSKATKSPLPEGSQSGDGDGAKE